MRRKTSHEDKLIGTGHQRKMTTIQEENLTQRQEEGLLGRHHRNLTLQEDDIKKRQH